MPHPFLLLEDAAWVSDGTRNPFQMSKKRKYLALQCGQVN
jgi:hypothetical protein